MSLVITGSNNKGEAYLILTQDDVEETVNLTGAFDARIDMSRFAPGKVTMCFVYEDAGEIKMDVQLELKKNEGDSGQDNGYRYDQVCLQQH